MNDKIIIAVDAMGGEDSPQKIIDGIELSLNYNDENFFLLYGDQNRIEKTIKKKSNIKKYIEIIHTESYIEDSESPLTAAKKSNTTSMWQAIESQQKKKSFRSRAHIFGVQIQIF